MDYDYRDIPRKLVRDNKSDSAPVHICVVDTETVAEPWSRMAWTKKGLREVHRDDYDGVGPSDTKWEHHRLRLGVARLFRREGDQVTRRKELRFTRAEEFWEWLDAHHLTNTPTWLFAHNLLFDLRVLQFPELLEQKVFSSDPPAVVQNSERSKRKSKEKSRGFRIVADPPTIINQWHKNGWKLIALDTLNWYRCSLAALGERIGIAKKKMPPAGASEKRWMNYCERDVEILEKSVLAHIQWCKVNDLGRLRFTLAGQAMAAWRHRFMKRKVSLHGLDNVTKLERACFYGGRTELFYRGRVERGRGQARQVEPGEPVGKWSPPRGPVHHLDVHGYYASIMRSEHLPCELVEAHFPAVPVSVEVAGLDRTCCALVEVDAREQFPVRTKELGVLFCAGRFWTALAGWELERAVASGSVDRVAAWSRYKLSNLFAPFVDWCDERRTAALANGDLVSAGQLKLLPNSLYGKWAQLNPAWERDTDYKTKKLWGKWTVVQGLTGRLDVYRAFAGEVEKHVGRQEHKDSFPAISAFIAAAGRERLYNLREVAGRQHVLYASTDGLYVTEEGYQRLDAAGQVAPGKLGLLDRQEYSATAEFFALNAYRHGRRRVQSGVKQSAVELRRGVYQELKFSGAEDLIEHGPSGGVWTSVQVRTIVNKYLKGGVLANGWIIPHVLTHDSAAKIGAAGYSESGGHCSANITVASGASGAASAAGKPAIAAST